MSTTIYTSEQNINIDRYSSVLYYETMDIYTSEFKDLIRNGFFDGDDQKIKTPITACSNLKEKSNKCPTIIDKINEVFNNPNFEHLIIDKSKEATKKTETNTDVSDNNPLSPNNYIKLPTLGIDIITNIIFKRLFENSLKYLIKTKKNTLFIFPKSNNVAFNQYIKNNNNIQQFYNQIINPTDKNIVKDLNDNNNEIVYINIYPENIDDTVEVYKDQITKNINDIKEKIKQYAIKPDGRQDNPKTISNIIYLVDKDNNLFIDYYKSILQKKYIDVLNTLINDFYSTSRINSQSFKRYSTITKNLSNVNKAYIIKILNTIKSTDIKTKIKDRNFENNIGLLLNNLELFYQIRLDKANKKKLNVSTNTSIFNIFLRFNNIDSPIITNEVIPNKNILYVLKSATKNQIGYFTLINENKKQYKFVLSVIENKYYKDNPDYKRKLEKLSETQKQESKEDDEEEAEIAAQIEESILEGKTLNKIEEKTKVVEIRYMYGKIQYKNIEKNLYQDWDKDNTIIFYKTINSYEIYKFFNHRMIDLSFKDNINIKYYKNTLYDTKSLIEFLKSEKKYNEKTRLAYEFINININNDLLLKYNNFIYDNFKINIDLSISENYLFIEKIKKNICDILFENNSLVYIKETNQVKNEVKEKATADNYKITNYKYYKINDNTPDKSSDVYKREQIQEYFEVFFNEQDKLKCIGNSKSCDVSNNKITLPTELDNVIKNDDKTISLAIVNITKELDKDTTGLLFASECKGKKQTLKQSYYNLIRKIKGDNVYSGGYKKKKKTKKNKKIRSRRIYFLKYPKEY